MWRGEMKRLVLLAVVLTLMTTNAAARDIIFVMPIDISGMPPDVDTAKLECSLQSDRGRVMGHTRVYVPLVNGGYLGQVRARFLPSGYPANVNPIPDAHSVSCTMVFNWACTSSTGGLGRCEYRPWDTRQAEGPAGPLFETIPGEPKNWDTGATFDPEDAVELPRRFR